MRDGQAAQGPLPSSTTVTKQPLELLHTDVAGPITPASKDGGSWLERKTGLKIKAIRSDRGREYLGEVRHWCRQRGIRPETTAPYTPEQNGKAERLNRVLAERMRSMLSDAKAPAYLWGEAVIAANYVRNLVPVARKDKTPRKLLLGKRSDVSHLRVWGITCYVLVLKEQRSRKMDAVSQKSVFVGYERDSKAYRVLVADTIKTTRDVLFDESSNGSITHDGERFMYHVGDSATEAVPLAEAIGDAGEALGPPAELPIAVAPAPAPASPALVASYDDDSAMLGTREQSLLRPDSDSEVESEDRGRPVGDGNAARLRPTRVRNPPERYADMVIATRRWQWKSVNAVIGPVSVPQEELGRLKECGTYVLVDRPQGARVLRSRFVITLKKDSQGRIVRYKSRLVVKAAKDWEVHQIDVSTAFLYGNLEEEIYMEQLPGYAKGGPSKVWLLKKALYGLRQAPRAWYKRLKGVLETGWYQVSSNDPALFHKLNPKATFALVHVDDILSASAFLDEVQDLKSALRKVFDITNMGDAKHYLGMEVLRDPLGVGFQATKAGLALGAVEVKQYQELLGSLNYLANFTRPDIAQALGVLSRFFNATTTEHAAASKSVLRYLAGTKNLGIVYPGSDTTMKEFCDADFAGDLDSRRSITGYVFLVNGGAVSWSSRLQKTVGLFTMESRAKHIDVCYHFVRERVEMQEISVCLIFLLRIWWLFFSSSQYLLTALWHAGQGWASSEHLWDNPCKLTALVV
ncbi:hypothetical protein AXG93_150s1040 [Marchantia polymorpha subsp. ruderalis]|uniref:Integrase catalytic domain-containing protein n=1 Tax=Marchantia polymorpha subsp. ruderalis TaxID=1480154 RepID=A0A176WFP9_MARPO|nr:hypothetical protein AXG93_150s1040 [Marchantia polymorpha subsp. ruderalis]